MPSTPRRRRALPLLTIVAAVPLGAVATARPAGASSPPGSAPFVSEAASFCTGVVNDSAASGRAAAAVAGEDAWIDLLPLLLQDEEIADVDLGAIGVAVAGQRDAITATVEALEAFRPTAQPTTAQAAAWDAIVTAGHELVDFYGRRAELLATEDPEMVSGRWEPLGSAGEIDVEVLAALGGERRDCARVLSFRSLPAEPTPFYLEATAVCSALANAELERGVRDDADAVLEAMADVYADDLDPADWPVADRPIAEATRLAEHADDAAHQFAAVSTDGLDDPAAWETIIDGFRGAARRYVERAVAMAGDDIEAIETTLTPGYGIVEPVDFEAVGIAFRDCSTLWY